MKFVIIDTNYFLRFLMQDNDKQYEVARDLFLQIQQKELIGYVSILVLHEMVYLLIHYYKIPAAVVLTKVKRLLELVNLKTIEYDKADCIQILDSAISANIDYTDALIIFNAQKLNLDIASFDGDLKNK